MTTGGGCHFFAYQSNSHWLPNKRNRQSASQLHIFLNKALRKKYPATSNIITQLKGDKINVKTVDASWCIFYF